jgi:thiosulfate/3-mercaptopyruvate sulfurtransferase
MYGYYDTLIEADVCMRHCAAPEWRFIDCRFDLAAPDWGVQAYRESHIPGAFYAHLEHDLSSPPGEASGRHPLPDWRAFAERMGRWGLCPDHQVVVYDQGGSTFAARLWWLLRAVGHRRVAVLDGGWPAWQAAGGAASDRLPTDHARHISLSPGTGWVTTEEVENNLYSRAFLLVDARSSDRFCGRCEPIDPVAGHIPGAVNVPFETNLSAAGVFLPPELLRQRWSACLKGYTGNAVVHMCGSGVTACHNLLAMQVAGLTGSRLYVGSWSEWVRNSGHPVATGVG